MCPLSGSVPFLAAFPFPIRASLPRWSSLRQCLLFSQPRAPAPAELLTFSEPQRCPLVRSGHECGRWCPAGTGVRAPLRLAPPAAGAGNHRRPYPASPQAGSPTLRFPSRPLTLLHRQSLPRHRHSLKSVLLKPRLLAYRGTF